jgi:hypothetical protein
MDVETLLGLNPSIDTNKQFTTHNLNAKFLVKIDTNRYNLAVYSNSRQPAYALQGKISNGLDATLTIRMGTRLWNSPATLFKF